MKRLGLILPAVLLTATMVLSLSACGVRLRRNEDSSEESSSSSSVSNSSQWKEESSSSESSSETGKSSSIPSSGKFATMEDYVNSEAVQGMMSSMMDAFEGMDMVMKGEGNKLIYEYTYQEALDPDTAAVVLKAALAEQTDTFVQVAESLKAVVDVDNPVVVVVYRNPDGSEIYREEFSADGGHGPDSDGMYATMEDYVNSKEVQSMISSILSSLDGMDITVRGEGNKFIYEYTYQEALDADIAAPALKSALAEQRETFVQIADSLKAVVKVDNPVVVVIYRNPDGSEIYREEFAAVVSWN